VNRRLRNVIGYFHNLLYGVNNDKTLYFY